MTTKISFAPHLQFSPEDQKLICEWRVMHGQIEEREKNGFETHEVIIKGADIRVIGGKKRLLMVETTVDYTANGKRQQYGINFISKAAILLVAFVVAGKKATSKPKIYVVLTEEARWGKNDPNCLAIPGGLLTEEEEFDLGKLSPKGPLREFKQETGSNNILPPLSPKSIKSLGNPVTAHPGMSDDQRQFYIELRATQEEFRKYAKQLKGKKSGEAEEGEYTTVRVLSLKKALDHLLKSGHAPDAFQAIARYAWLKGLIKLSR